MDALGGIKGGLSRESKIDLRTEARSPFRLARIILLGALGAGASIGLLIIACRLVAALKGGEGAPDVTETLQNLGINSAAVVVLGGLLYRDLKSKEKDVKVTKREEEMGRLLIDLGSDRVLPLSKLRGQVRPLIIAGACVVARSVARFAAAID